MIFHGCKVIVNYGSQKVVFSNSVDVSDKFRKDTNTWLAGFFGYYDIIDDDQMIQNRLTGDLIVNLKTYNKMKEQLKRSPV